MQHYACTTMVHFDECCNRIRGSDEEDILVVERWVRQGSEWMVEDIRLCLGVGVLRVESTKVKISRSRLCVRVYIVLNHS